MREGDRCGPALTNRYECNSDRPSRSVDHRAETVRRSAWLLSGNVQCGPLCRLRHRGSFRARQPIALITRRIARIAPAEPRETQGKLVTALHGEIRDVAVDVRLGSPTFGKHVAVDLSEHNRRQLWVPRGFAHGFLALSATADVFYKCDELYSPAGRDRSSGGTTPKSALPGASTFPRSPHVTRQRLCLPTPPRLPRY